MEDDFDLLDPTPNIHELFMHYDALYFGNRLQAGCTVEWSTGRMTLCAGVCHYDGRGGGCRIKLSEPLLKLRPTRDLKDTLLHEMIHAELMLQGMLRDGPDGHGPKFQQRMQAINQASCADYQRPPGGYRITVYHSLHGEVDAYRTHWWKCDRCDNVIKRAMNRPPQEADCRGRMGRGAACTDPSCFHHNHIRHCGGSYIKIKEPEKKEGQKKEGAGSKRGSGQAASAALGTAGGGATAGGSGAGPSSSQPVVGGATSSAAGAAARVAAVGATKRRKVVRGIGTDAVVAATPSIASFFKKQDGEQSGAAGSSQAAKRQGEGQQQESGAAGSSQAFEKERERQAQHGAAGGSQAAAGGVEGGGGGAATGASHDGAATGAAGISVGDARSTGAETSTSGGGSPAAPAQDELRVRCMDAALRRLQQQEQPPQQQRSAGSLEPRDSKGGSPHAGDAGASAGGGVPQAAPPAGRQRAGQALVEATGGVEVLDLSSCSPSDDDRYKPTSRNAAAAAAASTAGGGGDVGGGQGAVCVTCPVCCKQWREGSISNEQLNAHVDECLTLLALKEP